MTNIDQFESVFRSAVREQFPYAAVSVSSVAVITDLPADAAARFAWAAAVLVSSAMAVVAGTHDPFIYFRF